MHKLAGNASRSPHRIPFANGLRGIAALSVVLAHYCGLFWYSREVVARMTGLATLPRSIATPAAVTGFNSAIAPIVTGPFGVALFFLISGFVIPFAFERYTSRQFLAGRFFRLWPTYFCGFLLSTFFVLVALQFQNRAPVFTLPQVILHSLLGLREIAAFPAMDGVIWTLEAELHFYVLAAILGPVLLSRGSVEIYLAPAVLFFFAFAVKLAGGLALPPAMHWAVNEAFYCPYVIFMFVGVALNFRYRGRQSLPVTAAAIFGLLIAAALAIGPPDDAAYVWPSYLLALLVFLAGMRVPGHFWSAPLLGFLARISFPLYAVHALTGYAVLTLLVTKFDVSPGLAIALAFAASVTLAWVLHVTVEMPSHDFGKRIASRLGGWNPQAGARAAAE